MRTLSKTTCGERRWKETKTNTMFYSQKRTNQFVGFPMVAFLLRFAILCVCAPVPGVFVDDFSMGGPAEEVQLMWLKILQD